MMYIAAINAINNPAGYVVNRDDVVNYVLCAKCLGDVGSSGATPIHELTTATWDHFPCCESCGAVIERGVTLSREGRDDLAADRLKHGLARIWSRGQGWYYFIREGPRDIKGPYGSYIEAFHYLGDEIVERIRG